MRADDAACGPITRQIDRRRAPCPMPRRQPRGAQSKAMAMTVPSDAPSTRQRVGVPRAS